MFRSEVNNVGFVDLDMLNLVQWFINVKLGAVVHKCAYKFYSV